MTQHQKLPVLASLTFRIWTFRILHSNRAEQVVSPARLCTQQQWELCRSAQAALLRRQPVLAEASARNGKLQVVFRVKDDING